MALSTSRTLVTKTGISTTQVFDMGGINITGGDFNLGSAIKLGRASGIITCTTFSGSGASLTNLPAGNLTGTVADARISGLTASKLSGALPAISGANLTNIPAANITGTLPSISGANLTGVLSDIVEDTSPQLGGNLDVNTKNIIFGDSSGASDDRLVFGAGSDLAVYHDGTDSFIDNSTGGLKILGDVIRLKGKSADETIFRGVVNDTAELYFNGNKKLETTNTGTTITGNLNCTALLPTGNLELVDSNAGNVGRIRMGAGDDFVLYHDGNHSHLMNNTGELRVSGNTVKLMNGTESETYLYAVNNGAVEINHDNVKTAWTHGSGFNIKGGNTSDNTELIITGNEGQAASILMSADDGDDNADHWRMYSNADNSFTLTSYAGGSYQSILKGTSSRSIELNYQGSKKLETTSSGVEIHNDLLLDGTANLGNIIRTNYDGGGHMYLKNNSGTSLNFSSHFQTYRDNDEGGTTQTHIHYYHGGYCELLHQGDSVIRTLADGVQFRDGGAVKGQFTDEGLCFGTDTAEANALDDYEEGSWTPVIAGWDTFTPYTGSSYYAGWYTKVGNLINVGWKIYIQHLTTVSSTAHIRVQGLPFTAKSISAGPVAAPVRFDIPEFGMSGYNLSYLAGNDQTIYMYKHVNGGNNLVAMTAAGNRSNVWTMGTATYHTN